MARIRGGRLGNQERRRGHNRGYGKGQNRGYGAQRDRNDMISWTESSSRRQI